MSPLVVARSHGLFSSFYLLQWVIMKFKFAMTYNVCS